MIKKAVLVLTHSLVCHQCIIAKIQEFPIFIKQNAGWSFQCIQTLLFPPVWSPDMRRVGSQTEAVATVGCAEVYAN